MNWINLLRGHKEITEPPKPPKRTPLQNWAYQIAATEFPNQVAVIQHVLGLHEEACVLRGHANEWLAEVCFDPITGNSYRIRREKRGSKLVLCP